MKILSSESFNDKIKQLDIASLSALTLTLSSIQNNGLSTEMILSDKLYAYKKDGITIFYTKDDGQDQDTIILLDFVIIDVHSENDNLNKKNTHTVNENKQSADSKPVKNLTITRNEYNPIYNRSLNPIYNRSINPIYNRSLNPIYNRSINPIYNRSLNPIYNRSINPIYNSGFGGPYIYSNNGDIKGFTVKVDINISVIFNSNSEQAGLTYSIDDSTRAYFDMDSKLKGYFIKASDNVWLEYDSNMKWVGFLVENN